MSSVDLRSPEYRAVIEADARNRRAENLGRQFTAFVDRCAENGCDYVITHSGPDLGLDQRVEIRVVPHRMSAYYAPVTVCANDIADAVDRAIDAIDHHDWTAEARI